MTRLAIYDRIFEISPVKSEPLPVKIEPQPVKIEHPRHSCPRKAMVNAALQAASAPALQMPPTPSFLDNVPTKKRKGAVGVIAAYADDVVGINLALLQEVASLKAHERQLAATRTDHELLRAMGNADVEHTLVSNELSIQKQLVGETKATVDHAQAAQTLQAVRFREEITESEWRYTEAVRDYNELQSDILYQKRRTARALRKLQMLRERVNLRDFDL